MPRTVSEKANMLIIPTYRCQLSPLDTQRRARGYPTIVNNIQPCPKLCLLMPLARVGARTDSTTSYSYNARRGQFPRTRIGIVHRTLGQDMQYAPRVCTLVLFIFLFLASLLMFIAYYIPMQCDTTKFLVFSYVPSTK